MAVKPVASAASGPKPSAVSPGLAFSGAATAPVTGYLKTRQMGADGQWHVVTMLASKMTPAQLAAVKANGLNGPVPGAAPKPDAPSTPANTGAAASASGAAPSWIPRIGFNGVTPDINTGQIDWSKILDAAKTISAVDPTYAQDLSTNILTAATSIAPIQAEYQGLNSIVNDPITGKSTGKKKYELDQDAENHTFGQNQSSVFGNAARRGIGSSGMANSNLAKNNIAHGAAMSNIDNTVGQTHITNLYNQILGTLGTQDMGNYSAYMAALGRQSGTLPTVASAAGLS